MKIIVEPMARALAKLGTRHAFVVHGDDGLDEISLSGETLVAEVGAPNRSAVARGTDNLQVRMLRFAPENFRNERTPLSELPAAGLGNCRDRRAIV